MKHFAIALLITISGFSQVNAAWVEIGENLKVRVFFDAATGDSLILTSKLKSALEGHFYCGSAHPLGRPAVLKQLENIAQAGNFQLDAIGPVEENGPGRDGWKVSDFMNYDVIIGNSVTQISGNGCLTKDQQDGIQAYVEAGGKFLSIHATNDARPGSDWVWFDKDVITAGYDGHGKIGDATVYKDEDNLDHWVTRGIPASATWGDEYFNFVSDVKELENTTVLMHVDDNSFNCSCPKFSSGNHASLWYRQVGLGTVMFALNGHDDKVFNSAQEDWTTVLTRSLYFLTGWDSTVVKATVGLNVPLMHSEFNINNKIAGKISISNFKTQGFAAVILNAAGANVWQGKFKGTGNHVVPFDFKDGVYFVNLKVGDVTISRKVLVM